MRALICGGNWNNGVNCGPRTVNGNNYPWNVNTNIGARFACDLTRSKNNKNIGLYVYGLQVVIASIEVGIRLTVFGEA